MSEDSRRIILEEYLTEAISNGLTHKLACMVTKGKQKFEFYAGASDPKTEYDLASLTKIFCTTLLTAQAVAEDFLSLDEKPWACWPGVSIEHILTHRAGLPPWVDISNIQDVFNIKPIAKPGKKTVYSDMGFIALGALLEKRLGEPLDKLFEMPHVHFRGPEPVDDARCQALGGVAGHAGLFGTLRGVAEEALFFLMCCKNPQTKLEHVIKKFAEYPGPRALGFDKSEALSPKAFGHLGYTGTSAWIDPLEDAVYVLLMRRLDDGSKAEEIKKFRRDFHQRAAALFSNA